MAYWAVVRAVPHHDRLAHEGVALAGFETFVPKIRTRVGAQWRTTPLFGCYFFARIIDQWRAIERTIGVANVVKVGPVPSRCPDEEIAKLIARVDQDGAPTPAGPELRRSLLRWWFGWVRAEAGLPTDGPRA